MLAVSRRVRKRFYLSAAFAAICSTAVFLGWADDTQSVKIVRIPIDVLWRDPGDVASLNLQYGVGGEDGVPAPPFQFVEEDMSASNPKILVKDAKGRTWNVKWSDEARPEIVANRIAWACGYVTETEYFVSRGQIAGVRNLKRARRNVDREGNFTDARFQLRSEWPKFLKTRNWEWDHNPFVGTRELNGLKVLMMFVSNWDDKDARDVDRDSNLGVFETNGNPHQFLYLVADWGASFGRWGKVVSRDKWDCKGYAAQSASFVSGVSHDMVHFGYVGQHTDLQKRDIRVSDVAWVLQYLGRISDDQFRQALLAGGASAAECDCYGRALRQRVGELQQAVGKLNYPVAAPPSLSSPYPPLPPAQPQQQESQPPADQQQPAQTPADQPAEQQPATPDQPTQPPTDQQQPATPDQTAQPPADQQQPATPDQPAQPPADQPAQPPADQQQPRF